VRFVLRVHGAQHTKREREERKTSKGKGKALENGTAAEEDGPEDWEALLQNIDPDVRKLLVQVFSAAELAFAKRAGKKLEGKANEKDAEAQNEKDAKAQNEKDAKAQNEKDYDTDIEADPLSDDDLIDSDDEAEEPKDEDGATANARAEKEQRTLLAEKRLCEIGRKMIMAVLGGLLDDNRNSVKKRLEWNRTKLGTSWREICAFLEKAKKGKGGKRPVKARPAAEAKRSEAKRSQAIVIEDEETTEDEVMPNIMDDEAGREVEEEVPDEEEQEREVERVIRDRSHISQAVELLSRSNISGCQPGCRSGRTLFQSPR
jgi:cohesin complex subunit SA-1/2